MGYQLKTDFSNALPLNIIPCKSLVAVTVDILSTAKATGILVAY
jgi:hypothetical protein